jgi:hypothetical protein
LGNLGAPPTGLTNLFLKLGTRDCPLTTALRNQFPESGIATEFQLFRIKALDTNNQRQGIPQCGGLGRFRAQFREHFSF